MPFTEANFENAIIELFRDKLGYTYFYGPEVAREYRNPLFEDVLAAGLEDINPGCSE